MTLEDAIIRAEEVAEGCQLKAYDIERDDYKDLEECAAEHRQLAKWLKELKAVHDEDRATDDQIADSDKMIKLKKRTITERLIIAKSLIDSVIADSDNDQFRDSTKKTDDVPDIHVGKTDFQPGDKFILELGAERRMFGEFEIAGTDLYVETRLLEKLKRYEPENKLDSAQPEPPRAYWIRGKYSWDDYHYNDTSYKCSRCGKVDANIPRYCPGCGAKMEEEIR